MLEISKKNIFSEAKTLTKGEDDDYYMTARIVPFGQISRNGVMYDKESVLNTQKNLIGKPVLYNHNKEDPTPPRGEWIDTFEQEDGLYGKAKIYNTTYNKDLIEYLSRSSSATVSLEIVGKADKRIDEETGKQYSLAFVKEWLESSVVSVPGFQEAKVLSFEYYIAESLGLGIQKQDGGNIMDKELIEKVELLSEKLDSQGKLLEKMVEGFEVQSESFKTLQEMYGKEKDKSEDEEDKKESEDEDKKESEDEDKKESEDEDKKESEDEEEDKKKKKDEEDDKDKTKSESVEAEPVEEAKEEVAEPVEEAKEAEPVEEAKEEVAEPVEEAKEEVAEPVEEAKEAEPEAPVAEQKESVKFTGNAEIKNKNEGEVWSEMLKKHFSK